jgi:hypothetical protein
MMPFFISTLMTSTAPRHAVCEFRNSDGFRNRHFARTSGRGRLLLAGAIDALQMAAERRERTGALVVFGKRFRDSELAPAARIGNFAGNGRLRHNLAADLFGAALFFFFDDRAFAARHFARPIGDFRRIFLFLEATRGFFFGATARGFVCRLARVFLGFAFFGGSAFHRQLGFLGRPIFRVGVGALTRFGFLHTRTGKRATARVFFLVRQLTQHNAGTRLIALRSWLRRRGRLRGFNSL